MEEIGVTFITLKYEKHCKTKTPNPIVQGIAIQTFHSNGDKNTFHLSSVFSKSRRINNRAYKIKIEILIFV